MKQWKCTVCGHIHEGESAPESCPICGVSAEMFVMENVAEKENSVTSEQAETAVSGKKGVGRKWICQVCGYIHEGEEPPETCPVCGASKEMFVSPDEDEVGLAGVQGNNSKKDGDQGEESVMQAETSASSVPFGFLGQQIVQNSLHPISVHSPNGILPMALIFLVLSMLFRYEPLEEASFFSLIFTLISMPAVIVTGYVAWKIKFKGVLTPVFRIKMICAALLFCVLLVMIILRVVGYGSALGMVYLILCLIAVVLAGIAGHLGGKLVFR